ncbi:MAG: peptidylprolyl isomerase [Chloroflexota bacterium]|nr:peptidylprolyl isomerase [Chloroflexota bacterium]
MRKLILIVSILAATLVVSGCSGLPFQLPGQADAAATVNGKPIARADYERQVTLATTYLKNQGVDDTTPEGKQTLATMRDELLDQMIDQEIITQAAAKEGLAVTSEEIDKQIADTVVQAGGQDKLDAWYKTSGFTKEEYRQSVREQLTGDKLFNKVVEGIATTADQVHARHIMLATKEEADAVVARLKKGEDFAKVAQEVSLDEGSKADGGDLGFFPKGFMIPEFENAAFALEPGKFSDPVETQYGFHVIMVVERDAKHPMDEQILHANQQEEFAKWLDVQKSAAKIVKMTPTATK